MNLISIVVIFVGFWASIMFHEIGHIIFYYHHTNEKPQVKLGDKEIILKLRKDLTDGEYLSVLFGGMLFGFVPLVMIGDILNMHIYLITALLIIYLSGCKHDIKEALRTFKEMGRK